MGSKSCLCKRPQTTSPSDHRNVSTWPHLTHIYIIWCGGFIAAIYMPTFYYGPALRCQVVNSFNWFEHRLLGLRFYVVGYFFVSGGGSSPERHATVIWGPPKLSRFNEGVTFLWTKPVLMVDSVMCGPPRPRAF